MSTLQLSNLRYSSTVFRCIRYSDPRCSECLVVAFGSENEWTGKVSQQCISRNCSHAPLRNLKITYVFRAMMSYVTAYVCGYETKFEALSYLVIFFLRASATLTEKLKDVCCPHPSAQYELYLAVPWNLLLEPSGSRCWKHLQVKKGQTFTHQRLTTPSKPARAKPPWRAAATPPTSCP